MKKRRNFTREFKISVLREMENGKGAAQICRENNIGSSMLYKWQREYRQNPEMAFAGNGNICKSEAKIAERERLIGQLYAENAFLKKVLAALETRLTELRKQR